MESHSEDDDHVQPEEENDSDVDEDYSAYLSYVATALQSVGRILRAPDQEPHSATPDANFSDFSQLITRQTSCALFPCDSVGRLVERYSTDGKIFMSAGQDSKLALYDAQRSTESKWTPFKTISCQDIGWSVIDTAYSPDQRWVAYSSWSEYVHLCNIYGDFEIHKPLHMRPSSSRFCLFSIRFNSTSTEILAGSSDYHVYVYDLERGDRVLRVLCHEDDINAVAYADETSNIFVTGSDDTLVRVWDRRALNPANPQPSGSLGGHSLGITHLDAKGDGRYIISNGKDQCIKLWDLRKMGTAAPAGRRTRWDYRYSFADLGMFRRRAQNDMSLLSYTGHSVSQTLIRAYFSPMAQTGQRFLYSGSSDGIVYVWDVLSGELVQELEGGHSHIVRDVSWHPHLPLILSSSWDGTVQAWDGTQEEIRFPRPPIERADDDNEEVEEEVD